MNTKLKLWRIVAFADRKIPFPQDIKPNLHRLASESNIPVLYGSISCLYKIGLSLKSIEQYNISFLIVLLQESSGHHSMLCPHKKYLRLSMERPRMVLCHCSTWPWMFDHRFYVACYDVETIPTSPLSLTFSTNDHEGPHTTTHSSLCMSSFSRFSFNFHNI